MSECEWNTRLSSAYVKVMAAYTKIEILGGKKLTKLAYDLDKRTVTFLKEVCLEIGLPGCLTMLAFIYVSRYNRLSAA